MEFRSQDKRIGGIMPSSSLDYNHPSISNRELSSSTTPTPTTSVLLPTQSGGGERRRLDGNGGATLTPSQTLDHHYHNHHYHQNHGQQPVREPTINVPTDPEPVPVSIAVVGGSSSPVAGDPTTPRTTTTASTIRYRQCLKNHAASIGGHVVDGCGEFMPSGEEGTQEALKCAACECHRNFHRKEVDGEPQPSPNCYYYYNERGSRVPPPPTLPPPHIHHHQKFHMGFPPTSPSTMPIQPMAMAFGGNRVGATDSSSEELNVFPPPSGMGQAHIPAPPSFGSSKKRFRTKFSQEQKEKMFEFAEKIGWRIQKQDETELQQFCAEVGVKRQVLKVWMHNNKHILKK